MTIRWLVAKYMEDQRRREPVNVGVILLPDDGRPLFRFLGQRADGHIDGRRVKWAGSVRNFQAWVKYWHYHLDNGGDPADLLVRSQDDNYFLEFGGERILGDRDLDPASMADYLFGLLVEQTVPRSVSLEQISDSLLERVGIRQRVEKSISYEVPRRGDRLTDSVGFDYRYVNGAVNLLQRATLVFDDDRSWDVVHSVAWSFERVQELLQGESLQCVTLYRGRPDDAPLRRQVGLLSEYSTCLDVSFEDRADAELRNILHIDPPLNFRN